MKRKLGTLVLFVLLILTVVALRSIDAPAATTSINDASKTQYTPVTVTARQ